MKKISRKRLDSLFFSALIFVITLSFSFGKPEVKTKFSASCPALKSSCALERTLIYDSLKLNILGLSRQAYDCAIVGLQKLKESGKIINDRFISIVDFTKPSWEKRLFVIDLQNQRLLFNTYVAHGRNSGEKYASSFSNRPESFQSSLGFYETSDTYDGKNGYSLHLTGLESGINDKASERAIVMHGAPYVSENFIHARGCLGRSWGCPAIPENLTHPIIDKIKNGTCLFIFSENKGYLSRSRILKA